MDPSGIFSLHEFMKRFPDIARRVYFKGSKAEVLALDRQRVLRIKTKPECGCNPKCKQCDCRSK